MLFHHPPFHFRQLWSQEWQKTAAPLTIKPRAKPLIVPLKRGNHFLTDPPREQGAEGNRGGRKGT